MIYKNIDKNVFSKYSHLLRVIYVYFKNYTTFYLFNSVTMATKNK